MKKLLVITGAPGVGKTTLGHKFTNHGWKVYDLDDYNWIIPSDANTYNNVVIIFPICTEKQAYWILMQFPMHLKLLLLLEADIDLLLDRQHKRNRFITKEETIKYQVDCKNIYNSIKDFFRYKHEFNTNNISYNRLSSD